MKYIVMCAVVCVISLPACADFEQEDSGTVGQSLRKECVQGEVQTVARFNPAALETPEGLAIDKAGRNAYISLNITGEIRKVNLETGEMTTHAMLPLGAPLTMCGPWPGMMGEVDMDQMGNLYVGVAACDPNNRGIYRVSKQGEVNKIASLPLDALPNGLSVRKRHVYAADTAVGRIWRAPVNGNGDPAEVWTTSTLLDYVPNTLGAPGANGLQIHNEEVWVVNASASTIVAIPFLNRRPNSGAAEAYLLHSTSMGLDDFAVAPDGTVWGTTDPANVLVKINPDGTEEIVLSAEDGLDGPTAAEFDPRDPGKLYFTNAMFPFFPPTGHGPSLMSLQVSCRGGCGH